MHTLTHTLSRHHIYLRVNTAVDMMCGPKFYVTTGSISTWDRIHTNLKGLYLENTLLILSHTLATVLVTL